jgi:hypothetical protein
LLGRSSNVITKRGAEGITLILIAFGYTGAALSYSHLIGLNLDFPYLCPVCPHIDSLGPSLGKFIGRTIALGTVNAAVLAVGGWVLIGIVVGLKSLFLPRSR